VVVTALPALIREVNPNQSEGTCGINATSQVPSSFSFISTRTTIDCINSSRSSSVAPSHSSVICAGCSAARRIFSSAADLTKNSVVQRSRIDPANRTALRYLLK